MHLMSVAVAEDLHLDMVVVHDALLDEHAFILELPRGVIAHASVHGAELINVVHFLDTHAAAAGGSLDEDKRMFDGMPELKIEDFFGDILGFHLVVGRAIRSGHCGYAQAARKTLCIYFVSELTDDFPGRTDEYHAPVTLCYASRKTEVFGEETVPRVQRRASRDVGDTHEFVGVMIR